MKNELGNYVHAIETQAKLYGIKGLFDEAQANLDKYGEGLLEKADVPIGSESIISGRIDVPVNSTWPLFGRCR